MENKNLEQTSTYTAGSGGLAANYSWIQTLNMYKYELYGLVLAILIAYDLYFVGFYALKTSKRYLLKDPKLIKKYSFLFLGNIFSVITLSTLIFSGSDAQNIISRTLNYSMLFISLFIALSFNSLNISSNSLSKIINMFFIVFLLVTFITYPLYSYGRDSYINYPVSHEFGSNFYKSHISEGDSHMFSYSKAADFYQLMEGKNYGKNTNSTIYVNGWYTVYNLDIVNPKDNQNQNQRLDLM